MGRPSDDQLLAHAVRFLRNNQQHHAADTLLSCSLRWGVVSAPSATPRGPERLSWSTAQLTASGDAYRALSEEYHPTRAAVEQALKAVAPAGCPLETVDVVSAVSADASRVDVTVCTREDFRWSSETITERRKAAAGRHGPTRPSRAGHTPPLSIKDDPRNPYARNAFRVLGLSTEASDHEARRRVQERRLTTELGGSGPSELELIRKAEAALQDPARRLREEVYWVHLTPDPIPTDPDLADRELLTTLVTRLERMAESGSDEARHDLAVVRHVAALEADDVDIDELSAALSDWQEVWESDAFWFRMRMRAEELADPRVTDATVGGIRDALPGVVLAPSATLAARLLDHGWDAEAAEHLATILDLGFPVDDIEKTRSTATGGLRGRLKDALYQTRAQLDAGLETERARPTPQSGAALCAAWVAAEKSVVPLLERLQRVDSDNADVQVVADEVAEFVQSLAVRLYNDAHNGEAAVAPQEAAARLAASDSVRQRAAENLRILRSNLRRERGIQAWQQAQTHAEAGR